MRLGWSILFSLVFLGGVCFAQVPSGNVFVGYSYLSADTNLSSRANLNGWEVSGEKKIFPFVGLVADFSGQYGTELSTQFQAPGLGGTFSVNTQLYNLLVGPRVSVSVHGVRPFAHALFGAAVIRQSSNGGQVNDVSFATAVGGGVDLKLIKFAAWRVQGDLLHTQLFGNSQNNVRISTGLVFHF